MPYREKSDLLAEISRELATYDDPLGEVAGRAGLVESSPSIKPPETTTGKQKLVTPS